MPNNVTKQFVLAGSAAFTVEEPDGTHHTYRVQQTEPSEKYPQPAWFVDFLSGPDNESSYTKLGKLNDFDGVVRTYAKTASLSGSRKLLVLNRVLARVWKGEQSVIEAAGWKLHHEGKCGRCGRKLTTPESCERGIGPECAEIMGLDTAPSPKVKAEPKPLPAVPASAKIATPVRKAPPAQPVCRETAESMFASDLNLKAGQWPQKLIQGDITYVRSTESYDAEGELQLMQYIGPNCRVLTVFND